MLNATNWKELKKQLRQIQGKAIFKLERVDSMNDGTFYRVLHQVKLHSFRRKHAQDAKEMPSFVRFVLAHFKRTEPMLSASGNGTGYRYYLLPFWIF